MEPFRVRPPGKDGVVGMESGDCRQGLWKEVMPCFQSEFCFDFLIKSKADLFHMSSPIADIHHAVTPVRDTHECSLYAVFASLAF